jgi:hypothetical protein
MEYVPKMKNKNKIKIFIMALFILIFSSIALANNHIDDGIFMMGWAYNVSGNHDGDVILTYDYNSLVPYIKNEDNLDLYLYNYPQKWWIGQDITQDSEANTLTLTTDGNNFPGLYVLGEIEADYAFCDDKWPCMDGYEKAFFATFRNNYSSEPELLLWERMDYIDQVIDTASYEWQDGMPEDFSISYDRASGLVKYNVGGLEINFTYEPDQCFDILFAVKTKEINNSDASITDLRLNRVTLPDVKTEDGIPAPSSPDQIWRWLIIDYEDAYQEDGIRITGKMMLQWGTPPDDREKLGGHIYFMNKHNCTV